MNKIIIPLRKASRSRWFWLVLTGYTLRLVLMPLMGHNDALFMPWMTHFITASDINIYAILNEKFGNVVIGPPAWAPYPYGYYAFVRVWLEIFSRLGLVDLVNWNVVWDVEHVSRYLVISKLPYLLFDLLMAFVLFQTCGRLGITFWAWSPAAIYVPFMMGQNDLFATFFAVAGVYYAEKYGYRQKQKDLDFSFFPGRHAFISVLLISVGATFKIFPLLLLPLLVIVLGKNWWQRVILISAGMLIFISSVLPFISTPAFVRSVLFNAEGVRLLSVISIFGIEFSPFLISYFFVVVVVFIRNNKFNQQSDIDWEIGLAVLAFVFLWTPTPFYWLIWLTPFSVVIIKKYPRYSFIWLIFQISFVFMYHLNK